MSDTGIDDMVKSDPDLEREWTREDLAELERVEKENESLKQQVDAHSEIHAHMKRFLMVKLHEILTEILRLESASNDPRFVPKGDK